MLVKGIKTVKIISFNRLSFIVIDNICYAQTTLRKVLEPFRKVQETNVFTWLYLVVSRKKPVFFAYPNANIPSS